MLLSITCETKSERQLVNVIPSSSVIAKYAMRPKPLKKLNDHSADPVKSEPVFLCRVQKQLEKRTLKEVASALYTHRDKLMCVPMNILGLVTKRVTRNDPEWKHPEAQAALRKEVTKLLAEGVWDEKALSKKAVSNQHSDAVYSRLFHILGLKQFASDPMFKARIVLQGSSMHDSIGNEVFYSDTSSAPTSMSCIRSTVAHGALFPDVDPMNDGNATQADAEVAYVQRKLDPDERLYVVIPRELWTPKMVKTAIGISDPVFRLLKPLYGWQRSGNLWGSHLKDTLVTLKSQDERDAIDMKSIELQNGCNSTCHYETNRG